MLESLFADVGFAFRWLRKSPGFTACAVVSLAAGIGFNTALFAILDGVLFRPLPVAHAEQLADIYTSRSDAATVAERFGVTSYPDFLDLRAQNGVFSDLIGYSPMFAAINMGDSSRLTLGEIVTGDYFTALGVGAAAGRTLVLDDDRPGAPRVAMISYRYWTRQLGGEPVVGRTLRLRGTPHTIVGVAPRGFNGMTSILSPDVWVPMSSAPDVEPVNPLRDVVPSATGTGRLDRRGDRWLFVKGRLKNGTTVEHARANLDVLMTRLETANPSTNRDRRSAVRATSDVQFHPAADPVLMPIASALMGLVGLVLLIACANVASMLLARASGRRKEVAIRLAIGASRGRLVRQLVTESLVLAILGAATGLAIVWWMTGVIGSLRLPIPVPVAFDLRIDMRVLLFTTVVTCVTAVLAGLVPAIKATKPNLTADLRGDIVASRLGGRQWTLRDALIAGQMAIATLLLVIGALLTRGLIAAQNTNLGFQVRGLALVSMETGMLGYSEERSRQFYDQALTRVRAIPGVESVALATFVPFSLNFNEWDVWVTGRERPDGRADVLNATRVSPDYFKTIGIRIVEGRSFTDADGPNTPRVAVINETMARRYWPGETAVGKTFHTRAPNGPLYRIVGVAADHKILTVTEPPTPFLHVARAQQPTSYNVVLARAHGDAASLPQNIRRELLALEPDLVFVENQTMEEELAVRLFPSRASVWFVGGIGLVAMTLAAIGLYGVITYSVTRRTREIGIRMALGAHPASVLALIMRQGLVVTLAGLVVGCTLSAGVSRWLTGVLFGVTAADPVAWACAVALLLGVSTCANLIPARRAARIEPSAALHLE